MINNINYKKIYFIASMPDIYHLPIDNITEIAFIGRSNSGKSSVINALSNRKIAKTSKKQGSTKLINLFEIPLKIRLMDFPGYGYSNTSKKNKKKWKNTLNQYIEIRTNLIGIILIIDIRHAINKLDQNMIQKINTTKIPLLILLNKSDKLIEHISFIQIKKIKKTISQKNIKIIKFSTKTEEGLCNLQDIINLWYKNAKKYDNK